MQTHHFAGYDGQTPKIMHMFGIVLLHANHYATHKPNYSDHNGYRWFYAACVDYWMPVL
jgi:hypothetical protein